jgi:hypothetical protein
MGTARPDGCVVFDIASGAGGSGPGGSRQGGCGSGGRQAGGAKTYDRGNGKFLLKRQDRIEEQVGAIDQLQTPQPTGRGHKRAGKYGRWNIVEISDAPLKRGGRIFGVQKLLVARERGILRSLVGPKG